jgi:polyhydroxybutyrate depolymerase
VFSGVVPLSGTFWEPLPADCGSSALPIRHVHGTEDPMWPLEGRQFSSTTAQGDVREGVAIWRGQNGCSEESESYTDGPLACTRWTGCDGGAVELCMHDGGHVRRGGWAERMLRWLDP